MREFLEIDNHKFLLPSEKESKDRYDEINYVMNDIRIIKERKSTWEPNTTKVVKKHLKKGQTAIDLGASVGYFTLLFARQVGKKGKVISVEPTPHRFYYLKKNIKNNKYEKRVSPYNVAAWNKEEIIEIDTFGETKTKVKGVPIDNLVDKVDFIKIDTDGNELKVLKGLEKIFKKNKNLKMIFEYYPECIKEHGEDPKEVMDFIEKYFEHSVIQGDYGDERGLWNLFCKRL